MNDRDPSPEPGCRPHIIAFDPIGTPIHRAYQLPTFYNFDIVIINQDNFSINGWTFPYRHITKELLRWLSHNIHLWLRHHPDGKSWMNDVMETLQERLTGKF